MKAHKAVMLINLEVHEIDNGECSGKIVSKEDLENNHLKSKMILTIEGFDKNDCLTKVYRRLNGIVE